MKRRVGGIVVLIVIIFIWHNSLQDATQSEYASLSLVYFVQLILVKLGFTVPTGVLDAVLRKMAHLSEFTLLGFALCRAFQPWEVVPDQRYVAGLVRRMDRDGNGSRSGEDKGGCGER